MVEMDWIQGFLLHLDLPYYMVDDQPSEMIMKVVEGMDVVEGKGEQTWAGKVQVRSSMSKTLHELHT
jgi:hypothetical protein